MNTLSRTLLCAAALGFASPVWAGTPVLLTADAVNSSPPAFGSTLDSPLNDAFAYDSDDPTAVLPQQLFNPGAAGFHGNEADGADVLVSYTFPEVTLVDGETFALDLYGRDGDTDCCAERDDNLDIELFSGGVGGTVVETFAGELIANEAPFHLRLTFKGGAIDAVRITAHDTDNPAGSYFTLMEIRAAVLIDPTDSDGDGLPDVWETANNLDPMDDGSVDPVNGAMGNPDDDGLDNLAEYENDTDPRDNDSDDDMLIDGDEVAGAGDRPPTDPNKEDTDGDSLTDLAETNSGTFVGASDTGTDPTLADTDSDGADDSDEVRRLTDPIDPSSGNNLALGVAGGYFGAADTAVESWGGLPASNVTDGALDTISHPLDMLTTDYYFQIDLGAPISITHVAITGRGFRDDCCPERLEGVTLKVLDAAGAEVFSQQLAGQIIMTQEFNISAAAPYGQFVRVVNTNGADYGPQLGELEVFGSSVPPAPPRITDFTVDPESGMTTLTFTSQPGANYSIFASSTAVPLWEEINDSEPSDGMETFAEFTDLDGAGAATRLYRVVRNPPQPN